MIIEIDVERAAPSDLPPGGTCVVARRGDEVVGWAYLLGDGEPRPVFLETGRLDVAAYTELMGVARTLAGSAGMTWITSGSERDRQVAAAVGATLTEELDAMWESPRTAWPQPTGLGREHTGADDTLLAELYTRLGEQRCDETGCTTVWTAADVAAATDGQVLCVLEGPDGLRAVAGAMPEAGAGVAGAERVQTEIGAGVADAERVQVWVVEDGLSEGERGRLVAGVLGLVRRRHPSVGAAYATIPAPGFTKLENDVRYEAS
ncbi:hypothetical protein [Nonomuraea longicatena]|uniref:N-acetyltransferase domain-containing protein n=1 Tax=Nonomuraea longicatena TaxID=83682 RepID=A0ABP3ZBB8_9ACTN